MGRHGFPAFASREAVQHQDFNQWQNYGQTVDFTHAKDPWRENQEKSVLRWQQASAYAPVVHTVMLAVDLSKALPGNHTWRWALQLGVGGAKRSFLIDAIGSQQISVPVSTADVALRCEIATAGAAFGAPDYDLSALAYVSEYGTYSRLATLTQWFEINAGGGLTQAIPNGANAWRLVGREPGTALSPFVATTTVAFNVLAAPPTQDTYKGDQLSLVHASGDYAPIPGAVKNISIANGGVAAIEVGVQWSIDF